MIRRVAEGELAANDRRSSIELTTVWMVEGSYAPSLTIPPHTHRNPHCTCVLAGDYWEITAGRTTLRQAGEVFFHRPAEVHANLIGRDGARCLNLELLYQNPLVAALATLRDRVEIAAGQLEAIDLCNVTRASKVQEAIQNRLWSAILARAPRWLSDCVDALNLQFATPPRLEHLAAVAAVHPTHLIRSFRRQLGQTPGQYLQKKRVARACHLLATTSLSLVAVALEAGFCDQPHLHKVLRQFVGMTPTQFRSHKKLREASRASS